MFLRPFRRSFRLSFSAPPVPAALPASSLAAPGAACARPGRRRFRFCPTGGVRGHRRRPQPATAPCAASRLPGRH